MGLWDLDILTLGRWANLVRCRFTLNLRVTYVVDRNVNYTNIAFRAAGFCAFFRPPGHAEGYVLPWRNWPKAGRDPGLAAPALLQAVSS